MARRRIQPNDAGNVGIGTDSPQSLLSVGADGAIALQGTYATGTRNRIRWLIEDNSEAAAIAGVRETLANAPHSMTFSTRNNVNAMVERLRIDSAGLITGTGTSLGAWTAYTPTVTAVTGTFTTVAGTSFWCQVGKIVFFRGAVNITTNGTAATRVLVTLPVTARSGSGANGAGRETAVTGNMLQVAINTTADLAIWRYDNAYPGANGYNLQFTLIYEAA